MIFMAEKNQEKSRDKPTKDKREKEQRKLEMEAAVLMQR